MDPTTPSSPPSSASSVAAVIVAAGTGARFGGAKQYAEVRGRRVLDWSIAAARSVCDWIVLVVPPGLADRAEPGADVVVAGGPSRSASVRAGLAAVPEHAEVIVVHDAARPLAHARLFASVVAEVRAGAGAAVPGIEVVDTLRLRSGGSPAEAREDLVAVQTPQAFDAPLLRRVHAKEPEATDDASLVDRAGGRVVVVPGDPANRKITTPLDLIIADVLAAESGLSAEVEIGDVRSR